MDKTVDIHKAGGILLKDRRLLIEHSKGKATFNTPGGKLEANETAKQALVRELHEEFQITVDEADLEEFGTFYDRASGQEDKSFRMDVFTVRRWQGDIEPDREVEETRWVNSAEAEQLPIGSVFKHEILPRMKTTGLID